MEELKKRLELRGTEDEAERAGRMAAALRTAESKTYHYIVVNDDRDSAVEAPGCRHRRRRLRGPADGRIC
jgi:guanylate kinase